MDPIWYLDEPDLTQDNFEPPVFKIRGWIASVEEVKQVEVIEPESGEASLMDFALCQRPSVAAALDLANLRVTGFEGSCPFKNVANHKFVVLRFVSEGRVYDIVAPVHSGKGFNIKNKAAKLRRILPFLMCPYCKKDLIPSKTALQCAGCKTEFSFTDNNLNFLTEKFKKDFKINTAEHVSRNEYDGVALNCINRFKDGLILDCGAGYRAKYYENVVNYEIEPYPSTDVLGVAESLPFKNNTFDAVFSFAVLEHVKDPFACAKEIVRVLKPGGVLYSHVPFMSPFHGYPHHYYNMTQHGLWNLFSADMDIGKLDVLNFGHPIFTLLRFLTLYVDGLPSDTREQFMNMTVGDFLKPQANTFLGKSITDQLSAGAKQDLAFCNYLIARKKRQNMNDHDSKTPVPGGQIDQNSANTVENDESD